MLFDSTQRAEFVALQSLPEFKALKEQTEHTLAKLGELSQRIADDDSAFDQWYWSHWDAKQRNEKEGSKTRIETDGFWDEPVVQLKFEQLKVKQQKANNLVARCKKAFFRRLRVEVD